MSLRTLLTPVEKEHVWEGRVRHYAIGGKVRPGVTSVIDATSDKTWLVRWEQRLGKERAEIERLRAARRGTALHKRIEQRLLYGSDQLSLLDQTEEEQFGIFSDVEHLWETAKPFVDSLGEPVLIEGPVYWEPNQADDEMVALYRTGFGGTIDCVTRDPETGGLVLHDWKTSAKRKKEEWLGGYTLQQAAYAHAFEYVYGRLGLTIERCQINIFSLEGREVQVSQVRGSELKLAWMAFKKRVARFHAMKEAGEV